MWSGDNVGSIRGAKRRNSNFEKCFVLGTCDSSRTFLRLQTMVCRPLWQPNCAAAGDWIVGGACRRARKTLRQGLSPFRRRRTPWRKLKQGASMCALRCQCQQASTQAASIAGAPVPGQKAEESSCPGYVCCRLRRAAASTAWQHRRLAAHPPAGNGARAPASWQTRAAGAQHSIVAYFGVFSLASCEFLMLLIIVQ